MAPRDPYLARINRALRDLGSTVTLEVSPSGGRLRLRATVPLPDGSWKQRRIATPFPYPAGVEQARELAEQLGKDLELHRRGSMLFLAIAGCGRFRVKEQAAMESAEHRL